MLTDAEIDQLSIEGETLDEADINGLEDVSGPQLALPDNIDEARLLEELYKDLRRGEHAKLVLAEAEMRRVAEFNQQIDHRAVEGVGELVCRVPLDVYLYWVAREGPGFWREKSNREFIAKRAGGGLGNPGFLIDRRQSTTVVTVDHELPRSAAIVGEKPAGAASDAAVPAVSSSRRRGRWAS
jgi:hypothetical protein